MQWPCLSNMRSNVTTCEAVTVPEPNVSRERSGPARRLGFGGAAGGNLDPRFTVETFVENRASLACDSAACGADDTQLCSYLGQW